MPINYIDKGFLPFVFKNTSNLIYLTLCISISISTWVVFKVFYPNPNIIFDSYYYIYAAYFNENVSAWPIGFSKVLRLIGLFSRSIDVVLIFQYVFLQCSFLYFFFSIRYFFRLGEWGSIMLFVFFFINPIYIYTCNLVLSDAFFLGLSLIWLINLLWIIYKSQPYMILTQALLVLILFTIRHSALFYPVIACVAYWLSRQPIAYKIAGIVLPGVFVGIFMLFTINENLKLFGVKQFSPFQGWKVASNALYIYEHVPQKELKPVPAEFRDIDSAVRNYYNSKHTTISIYNPDASWGSYYMFMYPSPLLTYKDSILGPEQHFLINEKTLSKMGPLYKEYGSFILKRYPYEYARYFVIPNIYIYMMPYPEVYYDSYNPFTVQKDTLGTIASKWFGQFSLGAPEKSIAFRADLFSHYPLVNTFTHFLFLIGLLGFILFKGYRKIYNVYVKCIALISILWVVNFAFMVLASASLLRYQLFITVVEFTFMVVFAEFIFLSDNENYPLLKGNFQNNI